MALHFTKNEFSNRQDALQQSMERDNLDVILLFAPESQYWLTGFDTFGYCFFQCLIVKRGGEQVLLTRSADLRQAQHTSTIENIVQWVDRAGVNPVSDLCNILNDMDLLGHRIGIEYDTHGLTGANGRRLDEQLQTFGDIIDASMLVPELRLIKSEQEVEKIKLAAQMGDDALEAALPLIHEGGDEGAILAAMQGSILAAGGDYPANDFIIGSGEDALLCRYKSGRRKLSTNDQLTLEWAGVANHYHSAMMQTIIIGTPTKRHLELHEVAVAALEACEKAMVAGNSFGDVFDAHARAMEICQLSKHRLNACGYSLGARFSPSWMEPQMFFTGNPQVIAPNMSLFAHMIIMDSDTKTAMALGRTYLTTPKAPIKLSRFGKELITQ